MSKLEVAKGTEVRIKKIMEGVTSISNADSTKAEAEIAAEVADQVFDVMDEPGVKSWIFERAAEWDSTTWMKNLRKWWDGRSPFVKSILINSPVPNPATNVFRVLAKAGLISCPEPTIVDMQKTEKWSIRVILIAASIIAAQPELNAIIPICEKIMNKQNDYFTEMRAFIRGKREGQNGQADMFPGYDGERSDSIALKPESLFQPPANDTGSIWNSNPGLAA